MLRTETQKLWDFIKELPVLHGFVLVGGSALTLRIQHRLSEDLDLAWLGNRLPRASIHAFQQQAVEAGFRFQRRDDPGSVDEFEIAGMDLHDYQQDFLVNDSVKLSFFSADEALVKVLRTSEAAQVRLATLDELFASKALVAAQRSKTRDWFDLYILMTQHGKTMEAMRDAFQLADSDLQFDTALMRLCSGTPSLHDEGYEQLLQAAPGLEEMMAYFRAERDAYEQRQAAKVASELIHGAGDSNHVRSAS